MQVKTLPECDCPTQRWGLLHTQPPLHFSLGLRALPFMQQLDIVDLYSPFDPSLGSAYRHRQLYSLASLHCYSLGESDK